MKSKICVGHTTNSRHTTNLEGYLSSKIMDCRSSAITFEVAVLGHIWVIVLCPAGVDPGVGLIEQAAKCLVWIGCGRWCPFPQEKVWVFSFLLKTDVQNEVISWQLRAMFKV